MLRRSEILKYHHMILLLVDHVARIGKEPRASTTALPYSNTTFLIPDIVQENGVLFAYSAYFISRNPIRFQVWRPTNILLREFKLVHEMRARPTATGQRGDVGPMIYQEIFLFIQTSPNLAYQGHIFMSVYIFSINFVTICLKVYLKDHPSANCFAVQTGDRIGIFTETAPSSVTYIFETGNPVALAYFLKDGRPYTQIDESVGFESLAFPYEFQVSAYVDIGKLTTSYSSLIY